MTLEGRKFVLAEAGLRAPSGPQMIVLVSVRNLYAAKLCKFPDGLLRGGCRVKMILARAANDVTDR